MMLRRSFLVSLASVPFVAAQQRIRQIVLEGARNFRDIGGYPTGDRRNIRWGRVYRADSLANLTSADCEKLAVLDIRVICDYRSKFERDREPTRWTGNRAPAIESLDIMAADPERAGEDPTKSFIGRLMQKDATPETASRMMSESMARMAITGGPLFGKMMRRIVELDAPLLYHCSAGKDRTGLSTALLMKVLGVTQEALYEDYLLVNRINPPEKSALEIAKRLSQMTGQSVDPSLLAPLMGTRPEWLDAAFRAIDGKFGGFESYRRECLGLTDAGVASLHRMLLA